MSGEALASCVRTSVIRQYQEQLRKQNSKGRTPIELLAKRAEEKKNLWDGIPLFGPDLNGEPPISEGTLTVTGLREAYEEGVASYRKLCKELDEYLEGGEQQRKKFEASAGL